MWRGFTFRIHIYLCTYNTVTWVFIYDSVQAFNWRGYSFMIFINPLEPWNYVWDSLLHIVMRTGFLVTFSYWCKFSRKDFCYSTLFGPGLAPRIHWIHIYSLPLCSLCAGIFSNISGPWSEICCNNSLTYIALRSCFTCGIYYIIPSWAPVFIDNFSFTMSPGVNYLWNKLLHY